MFYNVQKEMKIMKDAPSVDDIKQFLEVYDSSLKAKLAEISTLKEVIRVIRDNCSLINIVILEAVVEQFEITGAQKHIDDYKILLMEFCKNLSVRLCLNESFDTVKTSPPLKCETVSYTLGWEPDEHKLKGIADILSKVSGKLVKLSGIINEENSITVTCSKSTNEKEINQPKKELIEKEERIETLTQQLNEATAFLQQSLKDDKEQNEQLQETKSS